MVLLVVLFAVCEAAKKTGKKEPDPKECEVCVSTLEKIDSLVPKDKKKSKAAIEEAINKHCTSGSLSGSDWKPNPALTSPRDVKMCYMFEPIKKAISQPFSTGMPKKKVCERLKKDNPEICEVKYRKLHPFFHHFCLITCLTLFHHFLVHGRSSISFIFAIYHSLTHSLSLLTLHVCPIFDLFRCNKHHNRELHLFAYINRYNTNR